MTVGRDWRVPDRKPVREVLCPNPDCRQVMARSDGDRLYLGASYAARTITLHCTSPTCDGRYTWHPKTGSRRLDNDSYSY